MADVKYPNIQVSLIGEDGNAFAILGRIKGAMSRGGVPQDQIALFMEEAMSGDYNHLLNTCMEWVDCDKPYQSMWQDCGCSVGSECDCDDTDDCEFCDECFDEVDNCSC